jgi:hypothetical protein
MYFWGIDLISKENLHFKHDTFDLYWLIKIFIAIFVKFFIY